MKTKAFSLVEFMIVIAIIALLAAITLPNMTKAKMTSRVNACVNNLRQIQAAKMEWAISHTNLDSTTPTWEDLKGFWGSHMPQCPDGGTYTIGALDEIPTCSIREHTFQFKEGQLDQILSGLPYGKIAYFIPKQSKINIHTNAFLRLSPQKTFAELRDAIQKEEKLPDLSATNDGSHLKFEKVKISNRMKATLETDKVDSDAISITPETESDTPVSFIEDTIWRWSITAHKPGTYLLHLQLAMQVDMDGHESYRTLESYSDTVTFHATASEYTAFFVKEHWEIISTLMTAIVLPLAVYLWKQRQKKTKAKATKKKKRR